MELQSLSLGWSPDISDPRDWRVSNKKTRNAHPIRHVATAAQKGLPKVVILSENELDLRFVDDASLNASSAFATISLLDWMSRRWSGERLFGSPLFAYQMTIKSFGGGGRQGISIRSTIKTIKRFGMAIESLWPSTLQRLQCEPTDPLLFGYRESCSRLSYYRYDTDVNPSMKTIHRIKSLVYAGFPCVFGFTVPDSVSNSPLVPSLRDRCGVLGGSAAIVMGFDDGYDLSDHYFRMPGAFRIRSCWGGTWGNKGYGWLPYEYVIQRWARDFWGICCNDWFTDQQHSSN